MRWLTLICGGLLWASVAFAVSRVGGGSFANTDEGVNAMQIPAAFREGSDIFPNGDVRLHGPTMIGADTSGFPVQEVLSLFLLDNEFPELKGVTDRSVFNQYFLTRDWTLLPLANPCLKAFVSNSGSSHNVVVSWGNGLGLLLSGPATDDIVTGIQSAIDTIALTPGACAWK